MECLTDFIVSVLHLLTIDGQKDMAGLCDVGLADLTGVISLIGKIKMPYGEIAALPVMMKLILLGILSSGSLARIV